MRNELYTRYDSPPTTGVLRQMMLDALTTLVFVIPPSTIVSQYTT